MIDINLIIKFIKTQLDRDNFITINTIQQKILTKFNHKYSLSFIHTLIKNKLKYSYKKVNTKLFHKSIDELIIKQKQFSENIKSINKDNIICIDETYLHTNYFNSYGWCRSNKRLVTFKQSNPIKYINLI